MLNLGNGMLVSSILTGKSGEHRLDLLSYFHPVTVAVVVLKRAFVSLNWNTFVVSLSLSACFDSNSSIERKEYTVEVADVCF